MPPETCARVWNDEPEDAELVIVSMRIDDPSGDAETVDGFWPGTRSEAGVRAGPSAARRCGRSAAGGATGASMWAARGATRVPS